jgi:hypothetical protein
MAGVGREAGLILAGGERSGRDMWPLNKRPAPSFGTYLILSPCVERENFTIIIKERENFTTKTFVAKKRHHKYSLLTAKGTGTGNRFWDLCTPVRTGK